jgi:hypothetical protein
MKDLIVTIVLAKEQVEKMAKQNDIKNGQN